MDVFDTHGMHMQALGLGTWRMKGQECTHSVVQALQMGYRHIDTAEMYGNEEAVGEALHTAGIDRDSLHVTSKVWWENLAPASMAKAIDGSLERLRSDYVDLYLVHWPAPGMALGQVMESLLKVKESGKARAIGVANFPAALLRQAAGMAPIACNQVEYHVLLGQEPLLATQRELGIPLVAYAPLAQGRLAEHAPLGQIAEKHGATRAQVALAWLLAQPGVAAIPKASREETQRANLAAASLKLDAQDLAAIAALPKTERFVNPAFAPAWDKAA